MTSPLSRFERGPLAAVWEAAARGEEPAFDLPSFSEAAALRSRLYAFRSAARRAGYPPAAAWDEFSVSVTRHPDGGRYRLRVLPSTPLRLLTAREAEEQKGLEDT